MWRVWGKIAAGLVTLGLVVLVAAAAANWVLERYEAKKRKQAAETFVATTEARQGKFLVYFDQIGVLETEKETPIVSEVEGDIVWIVPNGVRVKKGDLVVVLDTPRMEHDLEQKASEYYTAQDELERTTEEREADIKAAEVAHQEAQAALEQFEQGLKADLDARRAKIAFDRSALERATTRVERVRRLAKQGLKTRRDVEAAESELKSMEFALEKETKDLELAEAKGKSDKLEKQAVIESAAADLDRAKSRRDDEVNNAKSRLEILKRGLDRAEETLAEARIYAPTDGIVVLDTTWRGGQSRPIRAGDHIWPRRQIARIPDLSTMRVRMSLPQERAKDVKVGQKVEIRPDALRGRALHGEVTEVATTAVEESTSWMPTGERTFRAYVSLEKPYPKELKFGMRATARIIVDSHENAISVPLECVFEREGDKKIVYARRGGKFRPTRVVVGRASQDRVIVTKGLKAGEAIALRDLGRPARGGENMSEEPPTGGPSL